MNNKSYINYLNKRLQTGILTVSAAEKAAITAIDFYGAKGVFALLTFYDSECYLYKCVVDDKFSPKRFNIEYMHTFNHSLNCIYNANEVNENMAEQCDKAYYLRNETFVYDEYYDEKFPELFDYNNRLQKAISLIEIQDDVPLFVYGKHVDKNAVVYALQHKSSMVTVVDKHDDLNLNKRFSFSKKIFEEIMHVSVSGSTIMTCFQYFPYHVYVPLEDETLDSLFWGETTWRKILPNLEQDCLIADIPCKYITISMEVDGYNNVFCKVLDAKGESAYSLINNAMGVELNSKAKTQVVCKFTVNPQVTKDRTAEKSEPQTIKQPIPQGTKIVESFKDDLVLEEKSLNIEKGQTFTYYDLFGEYLVNVESVVLEDPYIYKWHQINNLKEFIKTAILISRENQAYLSLKDFHLITKEAISCIKEENKSTKGKVGREVKKKYSPEQCQKKQLDEFNKLKEELKKEGILFSFSFDNEKHDRQMVLSNGWTIALGRGLDIFNKKESDIAPITCKETKLVFQKTNKQESPKRKKRTLKEEQ